MALLGRARPLQPSDAFNAIILRLEEAVSLQQKEDGQPLNEDKLTLTYLSACFDCRPCFVSVSWWKQHVYKFCLMSHEKISYRPPRRGEETEARATYGGLFEIMHATHGVEYQGKLPRARMLAIDLYIFSHQNRLRALWQHQDTRQPRTPSQDATVATCSPFEGSLKEEYDIKGYKIRDMLIKDLQDTPAEEDVDSEDGSSVIPQQGEHEDLLDYLDRMTARWNYDEYVSKRKVAHK